MRVRALLITLNNIVNIKYKNIDIPHYTAKLLAVLLSLCLYNNNNNNNNNPFMKRLFSYIVKCNVVNVFVFPSLQPCPNIPTAVSPTFSISQY